MCNLADDALPREFWPGLADLCTGDHGIESGRVEFMLIEDLEFMFGGLGVF